VYEHMVGKFVTFSSNSRHECRLGSG